MDNFKTIGSQIIKPDGSIFYGRGMNVAFNTTPFTFVFEGTENGYIDFDLDDDSDDKPGGGVNSTDKKWSPRLNKTVAMPDRYYAINGYYSDKAREYAISKPADHWNQNIVRVNTVSNGLNNNPSLEQQLEQLIPAVEEALEAGLVVMVEPHETTGKNWGVNDNEFIESSKLTIELLKEFKDEPYFWVNPHNEPWSKSVDDEYFEMLKWWYFKIREVSNNVIVFDLANWGQDLIGLSLGEYDNFYNNLPDKTNVVFSWHAYGAARGGPFSYQKLNDTLDIVLNNKNIPIVIGEYGQANTVGNGTAGPDSWNRNAVEFLTKGSEGSKPLALKYNVTPMVWHATGDSSFSHSYKITAGRSSDDLLSEPFWRENARLNDLGSAHRYISGELAKKDVEEVEQVEDDKPDFFEDDEPTANDNENSTPPIVDDVLTEEELNIADDIPDQCESIDFWLERIFCKLFNLLQSIF